MANFDHLKEYDVSSENVQRYDFSDIQMKGLTPWMTVKPATEANKPFARAQLLRSNKRMKAAGSRGVSLENIEATRDDDRELYPRFVVTGWGNVFDKSGKEVPFSVKDCEDFLKALPDWIFDGLRGFCTSPANFANLSDEDIAAMGE